MSKQNALKVLQLHLKYAFSSLREDLQFNFNSHVFIDQMVWLSHAWSVLSLNVVRFVLKRGPFCP